MVAGLADEQDGGERSTARRHARPIIEYSAIYTKYGDNQGELSQPNSPSISTVDLPTLGAASMPRTIKVDPAVFAVTMEQDDVTYLGLPPIPPMHLPQTKQVQQRENTARPSGDKQRWGATHV